MFEPQFEMVAKTFKGLEPVLAEEIKQLGGTNVCMLNRAVSYWGNKALLYNSNFRLRTALRILVPLKSFKAKNEVELYKGIASISWDRYLSATDSLKIETVVISETFTNSMYVGLKCKDAIVDQFRAKYGKRPSVDKEDATVVIHIHLTGIDCIVSLDSSGESLHRRGYRTKTNKAPLNEVLAAGMILLSGWRGECDFLDPMCGSGTIPIEASLIATNTPPGVFRKEFGFEKWHDFDKDLFETIYNDESDAKEFTHKIYASDIVPAYVNIASSNAKNACIRNIEFQTINFERLTPPENCVVITNPPYGERMSTFDMGAFYEMIGNKLKRYYDGCTVWIISSNKEALKHIGLHPSTKHVLYNGALECLYQKFQIFKGKRKDMVIRQKSHQNKKSYPPKTNRL